MVISIKIPIFLLIIMNHCNISSERVTTVTNTEYSSKMEKIESHFSPSEQQGIKKDVLTEISSITTQNELADSNILPDNQMGQSVQFSQNAWTGWSSPPHWTDQSVWFDHSDQTSRSIQKGAIDPNDHTGRIAQNILSDSIDQTTRTFRTGFTHQTATTGHADLSFRTGPSVQTNRLDGLGQNIKIDEMTQTVQIARSGHAYQADLSVQTGQIIHTGQTIQANQIDQNIWTSQTDQSDHTHQTVRTSQIDFNLPTDLSVETVQSINIDQTTQTEHSIWSDQTDLNILTDLSAETGQSTKTDHISPTEQNIWSDQTDQTSQADLSLPTDLSVETEQIGQIEQNIGPDPVDQSDNTHQIVGTSQTDKTGQSDQNFQTDLSKESGSSIKIDESSQTEKNVIWSDHTDQIIQITQSSDLGVHIVINLSADGPDSQDQSSQSHQTDHNIWSAWTSQAGQSDQIDQMVHISALDQTNQITQTDQINEFQYEGNFDEEVEEDELLEVFKNLFLRLQNTEKAIHNDLIKPGRNQTCEIAFQNVNVFGKSDLEITNKLTKKLRKLWRNQDSSSNEMILSVMICLGNLAQDFLNAHEFNRLRGVSVLLSMLNCTQPSLKTETQATFPTGNCSQPDLRAAAAAVTHPAENCSQSAEQKETARTTSLLSCAPATLRVEAAHLLETLLLSSPRVQKTALMNGALSIVLRLILRDPDPVIQMHSLYALAHLIRNYPAAEAMFVKGGGLPILAYLFQEEHKNHKLQIKIVTMLHDLLLKHKMTIRTYPGLDLKMDDLYKAVGMEKALIENGWCGRVLRTLLSQVEIGSHKIKGENLAVSGTDIPEITTLNFMEEEYNFPLVDICHEHFNIRILKQDNWFKLLI